MESEEILKRSLLVEKKCVVRLYAVSGFNMASLVVFLVQVQWFLHKGGILDDVFEINELLTNSVIFREEILVKAL